MRGWAKFVAGCGVFLSGAWLGFFLVGQGLDRASLWASVLGLPLSAIATAMGAWAALLAAKTLHATRGSLATDDATETLVRRTSMPLGTRNTIVDGVIVAHTGDDDVVVQVGETTRMMKASRPDPRKGIASAAVVRNTLPRDISTFTGRRDELRALLAAVERGTVSGHPVIIHAIDGMAGVGKTALAVHAAHRLTSRFPDGVLFLPLHAHTAGRGPVEPGDALDSLLRETGLDSGQAPAEAEEKARLWRDRIAGKRILLVLDDAVGPHQIQLLIPGVSGCAVLVTSRRRLTSLEGATPIPLDVLPPEEAGRLFQRSTGRADLDPNSEAVAEVVRLAGHLPLAIRLLAARLAHNRSLAVPHLVEELAAARDRSARIGAVDEPISAAFDLSYNHLPPARQEFFRHLGRHPGTEIDAYAAASLAGIDLEAARAGLEALYLDCLISEPTHGRYRFHDLLRDYARALAGTDPAEAGQAAVGRVLEYYLHTARAAGVHVARRIPDALPAGNLGWVSGQGPLPPVAGRSSGADAPPGEPPASMPGFSGPGQAGEWFESERPTLIASVDYADTHGSPAHAIAIPAAIADFLRIRGYWHEAADVHRMAATTARRIHDRHGEAGALTNLGIVRYLTDAYPAAASVYSKALELYREAGSDLGEANVLNELGMVQYVTDDYPAATVSQTRALELYRRLGNRLGEANALNYLGLVQRLSGDYPAAVSGHSRALELYRELGNRLGEANALNYLALVQRSTGEHEAAAANLERALVIFRELRNQLGEGNSLNYLGLVKRLTGDFTAAADHQSEALAIFGEIGNRLGVANALNELGLVQSSLGDRGAAVESEESALALYRDIGDRAGEADALYNLGEILQQPAPAEAMARYEEALQVAREIGASLEEARALEGIGHCLIRTGALTEGMERLGQALHAYQRIGAPEAHRVQTALHDHGPPT
ncbi:tetratricopeptide repeat protein [Sphaerisporangium flaviroseum]|uniref:Tetratricopeptide repeat protein n=1 Tax=Sphaerisporangium flaviroseum TaxID=509199 RepID=A0ABP7I9E3_9ACTN